MLAVLSVLIVKTPASEAGFLAGLSAEVAAERGRRKEGSYS